MNKLEACLPDLIHTRLALGCGRFVSFVIFRRKDVETIKAKPDRASSRLSSIRCYLLSRQTNYWTEALSFLTPISVSSPSQRRELAEGR